jgi:hypothetical protein
VAPQNRQRFVNTAATFGDGLLRAVEFHQGDVTQARYQHYVRGLARKTPAFDVILHDAHL